jgi:phosphoribosylformimino-5-aminoimidazole carboxamide ribotide isomerase
MSWLAEFGAERIVLALDVRTGGDGRPYLATHGWTTTSSETLWDCLDRYHDGGARHVLCTDISRDGAMTGPAVELYAEIVARYPRIDLQASGGVRDAGDLNALKRCGAAAAITGRALLDGRISAEEIASFQPNA